MLLMSDELFSSPAAGIQKPITKRASHKLHKLILSFYCYAFAPAIVMATGFLVQFILPFTVSVSPNIVSVFLIWDECSVSDHKYVPPLVVP